MMHLDASSVHIISHMSSYMMLGGPTYSRTLSLQLQHQASCKKCITDNSINYNTQLNRHRFCGIATCIFKNQRLLFNYAPINRFQLGVDSTVREFDLLFDQIPSQIQRIERKLITWPSQMARAFDVLFGQITIFPYSLS